MNYLLPEQGGPIISILMLLGIIFIVATLSYTYSIWKQEQKSKELMNFLKNFNSSECALDTKNLEYDKSMKKPLFLLALAYQNSGDYSKAINLYIYLLKHSKDNAILKNLAQTYLKAGFLQRSLDIYLELIANNPRDKDTLYQIELIYERLNDFENAKDALEVLEAQGEDVEALRAHLKYLEITKKNLDKAEQFKSIAELFEQNAEYRHFIIRKLFKLNPKEAWRFYKDEFFGNLIDILDKLKKEDIDFDIISKSIFLKELFFIKGYLDSSGGKSNIFALNLLSSAKKAGFENGELEFSYICQKCKKSFPLPFLRCPNCHRVYSFNIRVLIEEKREKSCYSLQ